MPLHTVGRRHARSNVIVSIVNSSARRNIFTTNTFTWMKNGEGKKGNSRSKYEYDMFNHEAEHAATRMRAWCVQTNLACMALLHARCVCKPCTVCMQTIMKDAEHRATWVVFKLYDTHCETPTTEYGAVTPATSHGYFGTPARNGGAYHCYQVPKEVTEMRIPSLTCTGCNNFNLALHLSISGL